MTMMMPGGYPTTTTTTTESTTTESTEMSESEVVESVEAGAEVEVEVEVGDRRVGGSMVVGAQDSGYVFGGLEEEEMKKGGDVVSVLKMDVDETTTTTTTTTTTSTTSTTIKTESITTMEHRFDIISNLPSEISIKILGYLRGPKTLARCCGVNRMWNLYGNDELNWRNLCFLRWGAKQHVKMELHPR
jgi:hypothetical protein